MSKIGYSSYKGVYKIVIDGHADTEARCAAYSAIMYALLGYIENHDNIIVSEKTMKDGYFSIAISGTNAKVLYEMTLIGLMQVEGAN